MPSFQELLEPWGLAASYLGAGARLVTVLRTHLAQCTQEPQEDFRPKVKASPTKSGSEPHPDLLVCSVTGFYPGRIEIKWLKNGQEQTAGVVSTELLQNGDWTFQILVMLEMSLRHGDVYTCQVEHISLQGPIAVHW
ncbi:HLA class II histocompatibility antigen, DP beta 1 chain-like, partial [Gopherus evgoodei]|uniref:HLA class II histocompatibility antigen, DP beta 1 chain-like n=1 Tax=Gopherus evgoodei TaxID=1825980 RepID=UPI0011CEE150